MKPRQDSLYNGRNVKAGETVDVADRDVASMRTCGWNLITQLKPAAPSKKTEPTTVKGKK